MRDQSGCQHTKYKQQVASTHQIELDMAPLKQILVMFSIETRVVGSPSFQKFTFVLFREVVVSFESQSGAEFFVLFFVFSSFWFWKKEDPKALFR